MSKNDKDDGIKQRLEKLGIKEDDLIEKFILGSGAGGQKINKTSSCVYLKHIPTGIEVKCQKGRSRAHNRYLAYTQMCDEIERQAIDQKKEEKHQREKLRRQKVRRTRAQQEKTLESKKRRSLVKFHRRASE